MASYATESFRFTVIVVRIPGGHAPSAFHRVLTMNVLTKDQRIFSVQALFSGGHARTGVIQSVQILLSSPFHPSTQLMDAQLAKKLSNAASVKVVPMQNFLLVQ
jgi:hypothetical protein